MCGSGPKWKREVVQDHKFTYIDVNEFYEPSPARKAQYSVTFMIVIRTFLVYLADLWTAVLLVTAKNETWNSSFKPLIPTNIARWIFVGSISISFLLMIWEWNKARRIIRSQDIAYAFTNITAYRYYCVRSYSHYCLFQQINNSTTKKESLAFWIFFRLKGWKRILFAEAPRQFVNLQTIWSLLPQNKKYINKIAERVVLFDRTDLIRSVTFGLMSFTALIFALSFVALIIAFILYIPLLCAIRGNLKEYVCHLIDKRIANILVRKSRRRIKEEQKFIKRMEKQLNEDRVKKGLPPVVAEKIAAPQPTLPNVQHVEEARSVIRRTSGETIASQMTGYSTHALLREEPPPPMPPPVPMVMPPNPNSHLPVAMRSVRPTEQPQTSPPPTYATHAPVPMAQGGILVSNPINVQQTQGFGARLPFRAASRRQAPKQLALEENAIQPVVSPVKVEAPKPAPQERPAKEPVNLPVQRSNLPVFDEQIHGARVPSFMFDPNRNSYQISDSPPLSPVAASKDYLVSYSTQNFRNSSNPFAYSSNMEFPSARIDAPPPPPPSSSLISTPSSYNRFVPEEVNNANGNSAVTRSPSQRREPIKSVVLDGIRRPAPPNAANVPAMPVHREMPPRDDRNLPEGVRKGRVGKYPAEQNPYHGSSSGGRAGMI